LNNKLSNTRSKEHCNESVSVENVYSIAESVITESDVCTLVVVVDKLIIRYLYSFLCFVLQAYF